MANQIDTRLYIPFSLQAVKALLDVNQGCAAAGNDTFFYCCAGCIECIFQTKLLILHFYFGCCAYFNDSYAARQLSQTFLKLILVELRCGVGHLFTNLRYSLSNQSLISCTADNNGVVLGNANLMSAAQISRSCAGELTTHIFADNGCAGQACNILKHSLTTITEAWCLNGCTLQCATESVNYQGCQSFAFYIFSDDKEFLAGLNNLFQKWKNVLEYINLLIGDEDQWIIHDTFHLICIRNHIWADIPAVKLHTFYYAEVGSHSLGIFYSDNAVIANLFHSIGNKLTNCLICSRNGCDLSNGFLSLNRNRLLLDFFNQSVNCHFNTLLEYHRVSAGSNVSHPFMNHGLCKQGCSCGTIASYIIGLGCNFLDQLCTHIFNRIFQFNFTGNGNTIIYNVRCAILLVQYNVTSLWSKSNLNRIGQLIYTSEQGCASFFIIKYFLCHNIYAPLSISQNKPDSHLY